MVYFKQEFIDFFKELEQNNTREWFKDNKKAYEQNVKIPFEIFVADLIECIQKHDKSLNLSPKECIFRIHRDIRFSKDKSPYKTNVSAIIGKDGRKGGSIPGSYIELNHKYFRFYGGCYMPEKQNLADIRYEIANNPEVFKALYEEKAFKSHFKEIKGEKNKILAPDLKEPAASEPYLYNKQFYYFEERPSTVLLSENLLKSCEKSYLASKPMLDFLSKAGGYAEL